MTNLQMTCAKRQVGEDNGEIGPDNSAKESEYCEFDTHFQHVL